MENFPENPGRKIRIIKNYPLLAGLNQEQDEDTCKLVQSW
jgi:hypothetical protein